MNKIRENKYTVFLTYASGIIFIIALNYIFRMVSVKVSNGMNGLLFLIFLIPVAEGIIIGMQGIMIYKLQLNFINKYFTYFSMALLGALLLIDVKISGFLYLYLGVSVFAALVASMRRDFLLRKRQEELKTKKKRR